VYEIARQSDNTLWQLSHLDEKKGKKRKEGRNKKK